MAWSEYVIENRRSGMLIGLNGVAQSGKDTVGQILCENHGFERLAFADALRIGLYNINPIITIEVVAERQGFWEWFEKQPERRTTRFVRLQELVDTLGWDKAKVEYSEVRELMQRYGTEGGREVHGESCWTNILKKIIEANPNTNYVITDMRFENEVKLVGQLRGNKVQVQRPSVTSVNNHASDRILPEDLFDGVLENNGTVEELEAKVNQMVVDLNPNIGVQGTEVLGRFQGQRAFKRS